MQGEAGKDWSRRRRRKRWDTSITLFIRYCTMLRGFNVFSMMKHLFDS